jgi:hypothetical protein
LISYSVSLGVRKRKLEEWEFVKNEHFVALAVLENNYRLILGISRLVEYKKK